MERLHYQVDLVGPDQKFSLGVHKAMDATKAVEKAKKAYWGTVKRLELPHWRYETKVVAPVDPPKKREKLTLPDLFK